ncbi:MAG: GFA family protein [Casimicrobiaceae bacterium]
MPTITGSCLCGAIRYTSSAEPALTAFCHCRDCQKAGGGGYSVNVAVPSASLKTVGNPQTYDTVGSSGLAVARRFCAKCGSALFTEATAFAGLTFVKGSSLDDPSWIEPTLHIWCDSAQPWDKIPKDATLVPKNPSSS